MTNPSNILLIAQRALIKNNGGDYLEHALKMVNMKILLQISFIFFATSWAWPIYAAFPDHPIKLVTPFPAGGTVDAVARMSATQLGLELSTPVLVENVAGAGGAVATQRVAKSAPDGYTLLFTTPNHTINPAFNVNLGYDTTHDLIPISLVAQIPELLIVHASMPFSDFPGFVKYAAANPGKLDYASAGNGTLPHVTMELLLHQLGLKLTHIPYKGAAPALNDVLSGNVAIKFDTIATSASHIQSGRIKPLAIASYKRSPLMPNLPTIAESGLPGYQGILWMGILTPTGTPQNVINMLYQSIRHRLTDPSLMKKFENEGVEITVSSPTEFKSLIDTELKQWSELVKRANIKPD
jgi:tripartite-type tricarboxylate transporter receptor subunit TctC